MIEIFTGPALWTIFVLSVLNIVLGADNNLFIALKSNQVEAHLQSKVRKQGILLAALIRILLLFGLLKALEVWTDDIFMIHSSWFELHCNFQTVIFFAGALFMLYTGLKEIVEVAVFEKHGIQQEEKVSKPYMSVLGIIILGNVLFSADSILSAIPFVNGFENKFLIVLIPTIVGSTFMYVFADAIAKFIKKSIAYEIIGLYILFLVGLVLLSEGAHVGKMMLFGWHVPALSKTSFYFSVISLAGVQAIRDIFKIQYNIVPFYVLCVMGIAIVTHIAEYFHANLFGIEIHEISQEAFYLGVGSLSMVHILQNIYKKRRGVLPEIPTFLTKH